MPDIPHNTKKRYQEIEDIPLSPDIEWMLQSRQVGPEVIVEGLVGEYYRALFQISLSIVGDPDKAKECVSKTLLLAVRKSHKYWGRMGVKIWLFNLCVYQCMKSKRGFRIPDLIASSNKVKPNRFPGPSGGSEHGLDAEIWNIMEGFKTKERLVLVLHYGFELTAPEIAAVLRYRANTIRPYIHEAKRRFMFQLQKLPGNPSISENYVKESLQIRYGIPRLTHEESKIVIADTLGKLKHRESNNKRRFLIQQVFLVALIIGIIAGISWMTNVFAAPSTRSAVVKTVIVTQVVFVPMDRESSSAESQQVTHEMLHEGSGVEAILERMQESATTWETLWLDGRLIDYGPPGYTGRPQTRHEQVWVSQPINSLVLTGWAGGEVDHIWYASDSRVYDVDISTGRPVLYDFHPDRLPIYSPFEDQIFPERTGDRGIFTIAGSDKISGRNAIILDLRQEDNKRSERWWVDSLTGLILRKIEYAGDGESVVFEVAVRHILYDVAFPKDFFNRNKLIRHFSSNYDGEPFPISEESTIPRRTPAPGHAAMPQTPPPVGFDPSDSELRFQWNQPPIQEMLPYSSLMPVNTTNQGDNMPVSLFADGFYLGELKFNPWNASCERSFVGDTIAISSAFRDQDTVEYSVQVIDLSAVNGVRDLSSEVIPMDMSIAMNPRKEQLAYFGCKPDEGISSCGIYLTDLRRWETTRIYPSDNIHRMLWSPDGRYLALSIFQPARHNTLVFDVNSTKLMFSGNYDFQNDLFPPDAPVHSWDIKISEQGIEACRFP